MKHGTELRAALAYRPFVLLLAGGMAIRLAVTALYFPAVMLSYDSGRFARVNLDFFGDFWMPAGYPLFLAALRRVSTALWFTIAVQHLLGLVAATLAYLTVVRLGVARAWACIPAAVILFSGDHLYLEHIIMADTLLIAMVVAALWAAVRGLVPEVDRGWLAVAGALAGASMLVRSVGLVLVGTIPLCVAVWSAGGLRERTSAAAAVLIPAVFVLGAYVGVWAAVDGRFLGLSDMRGWNLYARVGPFADCRRFAPPPGLEDLCETVPPDARPGSYFYSWDVSSPARRKFAPVHIDPAPDAQLEAFAWRAIVAQPLDYAAAVVIDLLRYVEPAAGIERGYAGQPREFVAFGYYDADVERSVADALARRYTGVTPRVHARQALDAYQAIARVGGVALVILAALTIVGLVRLRHALQYGVALFGLAAFGLYLLPTLTLSYDFRYGIPPETLLVVSGLVAAVGLGARRQDGFISDRTGRMLDESRSHVARESMATARRSAVFTSSTQP